MRQSHILALYPDRHWYFAFHALASCLTFPTSLPSSFFTHLMLQNTEELVVPAYFLSLCFYLCFSAAQSIFLISGSIGSYSLRTNSVLSSKKFSTNPQISFSPSCFQSALCFFPSLVFKLYFKLFEGRDSIVLSLASNSTVLSSKKQLLSGIGEIQYDSQVFGLVDWRSGAFHFQIGLHGQGNRSLLHNSDERQ